MELCVCDTGPKFFARIWPNFSEKLPLSESAVMTRRNTPQTLIRRLAFPDSVSRAVVTPIQQSVVYASPSPDMLDAQYEGREAGYTYAREGHPNADVLAAKIDMLEGGTGGVVTGSGMAAVTAALMGLLKSGDHVIGGDQLYGRSLRMMREDLPRFGIETSLTDPTDAAAIEAAALQREQERMDEEDAALRLAEDQMARLGVRTQATVTWRRSSLRVA